MHTTAVAEGRRQVASQRFPSESCLHRNETEGSSYSRCKQLGLETAMALRECSVSINRSRRSDTDMPKLLRRGQSSAHVSHFCIATGHLVSFYTLRLLPKRASYIVAAHFFIAMHVIIVLAWAYRYELIW